MLHDRPEPAGERRPHPAPQPHAGRDHRLGDGACGGERLIEVADARSLGDVVRLQAKARPDAVVFEFEGRLTTFSEFDRHSNQVANGLIGLGVKPGDRIAYLGKNSDSYFEVVYGAAKAGVVMAPINWRLAPPEIA